MSQAKHQNPWDQVAENYIGEVISPIHHYKKNPLFTHLKRIRNKKEKHVADLGCGTGDLIPKLTKSFQKVTAIDFSAGMIEKSREQVHTLKPEEQIKATLIRDSLTNLEKYSNSFDVAIAVNSIITNNLFDLEKTFNGLYKSIKQQGTFLGILPSMESVQEEYQHTYKKELKKYKSHELAQANTNKKMEAKRINFALGLYNTDDMEQKYFTRYELRSYLEAAGFKNITFDRVVYERGHSYNYSEDDLKDHPLMWDWFVKATK